MKNRPCKGVNGFTLVELLISIVILGILVGVALPSISNAVNNAKIKADTASLRTLNSATKLYGAIDVKPLPGDDIFSGINDDEARMQILVDKQYLSEILPPRQDNGHFTWGIPEQIWGISLNETPAQLVYTPEMYFNTINNNQNPSSNIYGYDREGGLDVVIPPVINGIAITAIKENAFNTDTLDAGVEKLTSLILPDGLIIIGGNAFKSNALSSIVIPDSVTTIKQNAFGENNLTSVSIGDNVTQILGGAFHNNNITAIVFPDSISYIGDGAFSGNPITQITIGNNVTLSNTVSAGQYGNSFKTLYDSNGKQEGTYVYQSGVWVKQ